ncbi:MAG: helix-turn-helix domain-containing protein [Inhella sp.]
MRYHVHDQTLSTESGLEARLAQRLAGLRAAAGLSLDQLAQKTGISRATLSRLERGETSPGAGLLNRLCAAYGLTLSRLLAEVESQPLRLLRAAEQTSWRDKGAGLNRHMRCPPLAGFATELLEIELAAGSGIDYEVPPIPGLEYHLLMHAGRLRLTLEGQQHELRAGDTLSYKLFGASRYEAFGATPARYLLALTAPR